MAENGSFVGGPLWNFEDNLSAEGIFIWYNSWPERGLFNNPLLDQKNVNFFLCQKKKQPKDIKSNNCYLLVMVVRFCTWMWRILSNESPWKLISGLTSPNINIHILLTVLYISLLLVRRICLYIEKHFIIGNHFLCSVSSCDNVMRNYMLVTIRM